MQDDSIIRNMQYARSLLELIDAEMANGGMDKQFADNMLGALDGVRESLWCVLKQGVEYRQYLGQLRLNRITRTLRALLSDLDTPPGTLGSPELSPLRGIVVDVQRAMNVSSRTYPREPNRSPGPVKAPPAARPASEQPPEDVPVDQQIRLVRQVLVQLEGSDAFAAVPRGDLEEFKTVIDEVRTTMIGLVESSHSSDQVSAIRTFRLTRTAELCQNTLADIVDGTVTVNTPGFDECRDIINRLVTQMAPDG